jgi:radical SAM superfamily enzyme YgiQ (UPF0313 family)
MNMPAYYRIPKEEEPRILLVNAPSDGNVEQVAAANQSCFPPMGVVSLATQVKNIVPHAIAIVLDGSIIGQAAIFREIRSFRPHFIGVSDLTPTHIPSLEIAKFAKEECGSIVVLGNDHAAMFGRSIVKDCPFVDFVVTSDVGEPPFSLLLRHFTGDSDVELSRIPNLAYRDGEEVVVTSGVNYPLNQVYQRKADIPDYSLLQHGLSPYVDNYNARFSKFHDHKVIPVCVNNVRGCGNGRRRCAYCSILDLSLRWGNPKFFWMTLEKYCWEFGANFFFEVCDSFGTFKKYRKELLETMPRWFEQNDLELMVYCRAQDLANDNSLVSDLQRLKVRRVNIGLDAASSEALIAHRKGNTVGREDKVNVIAVERLAEAGIQIHASFIAGAIGETWESLEETIRYIRDLSKLPNVVTIEFSRLVPLPNSPIWDIFLFREPSSFYPEGVSKVLERYGLIISDDEKSSLQKTYGQTHILNLEAMTEDWIRYFTHLENKSVCKLIGETNEYLKSSGKVTGVNVA